MKKTQQESLIEQYSLFAYKYAKNKYNKYCEEDCLIQISLIGLIKAIDNSEHITNNIIMKYIEQEFNLFLKPKNNTNVLKEYNLSGSSSDRSVNNILFNKALSSLSEDEVRLINLRYQLNYTQEETSLTLGLTIDELRTKEKKILAKIKENIAHGI